MGDRKGDRIGRGLSGTADSAAHRRTPRVGCGETRGALAADRSRGGAAVAPQRAAGDLYTGAIAGCPRTCGGPPHRPLRSRKSEIAETGDRGLVRNSSAGCRAGGRLDWRGRARILQAWLDPSLARPHHPAHKTRRHRCCMRCSWGNDLEVGLLPAEPGSAGRITEWYCRTSEHLARPDRAEPVLLLPNLSARIGWQSAVPEPAPYFLPHSSGRRCHRLYTSGSAPPAAMPPDRAPRPLWATAGARAHISHKAPIPSPDIWYRPPNRRRACYLSNGMPQVQPTSCREISSSPRASNPHRFAPAAGGCAASTRGA